MSHIPAQLRARRTAAGRQPPLDCGCRDPWPCRCSTEQPPSDQALDGWVAAALHVLDTGQIPVFPREVCRALWRRGGPDRALAELVCQGRRVTDLRVGSAR